MRFPTDQQADYLTIGINRAAIYNRCDCWACLDWLGATGRDSGLIGWTDQIQGLPTLLTTREALEGLHRHGRDYSGRVDFVDDVAKAFASPVLMYSLTAAMAYAANAIGATELHLWGVDFIGHADWDGRNQKLQRGNWMMALMRYEAARAECEVMGVKVERH